MPQNKLFINKVNYQVHETIGGINALQTLLRKCLAENELLMQHKNSSLYRHN